MRYSKELKIEAMRLHFEEGFGVKTIARKLGIASHSTVWKWIQKYNAKGEDGLNDDSGGARISKNKSKPSKEQSSKDEYIKQLEMENELLKKLMEYKRRDAQRN